MIKNVNLKIIKNIIYNDLNPIKFISYNNGDLISIYASSELLPNTLFSYKNFLSFTKENKLLQRLLNISLTDIKDLKKYIEEEKVENKKEKTIEYNSVLIRNIIFLYKIFTSYTNFIKNLFSENDLHNYEHFIDIVSKPNDNLFRNGINILIFNEDDNNIICNSYLSNTSDTMILIKNNKEQFTPVYHIRMNNKGNISGNYGYFNINKFINIDNKTFKYFKNKNVNLNNLENTKNRSVAINTLLNIHIKTCDDTNQKIDNIYNNVKKVKKQ